MFCGAGANTGSQPMYASGVDNMPKPYSEDPQCNACVENNLEYKTYKYPCSRMINRTVTVNETKTTPVDRQVARKYTTYEQVRVQEPTTVYKNQVSYQTTRQPTMKKEIHTVMRPKYVTKKVPKVEWVDVKVKYMEPQQEERMVPGFKEEVKPVLKAVPVREMREVVKMKPVEKTCMTTQRTYQTRTVPTTKTVCQEQQYECKVKVPVWKVRVKPRGQCGQNNQLGGAPTGPVIRENFNQVDSNNDGIIDRREFAAAQQRGQMGGSHNWRPQRR